jgi:hypothetical protein
MAAVETEPKHSPSDELRAVLEARLQEIDAEFERAKDHREQKVKAANEEFRLTSERLQELRDALAKVLTLEGGAKSAPSLALAEFFVRLARAEGPRTKDEFRESAAAAGYIVDKRITHATVINIERSGRLELQPDGRYRARLVKFSEPRARPDADTPF